MTGGTPGNTESAAFVWPAGTDWDRELAAQRGADYFVQLEDFVAARRQTGTVYPDRDAVFRALQLTSLADVKFVIVGQDPYHGPGQAHGLCFSVPTGVRPPPSLRNILREMADDYGSAVDEHGDLGNWARQGGLLLNSVLTVDAGEAHSHRGQGWETLTDEIIALVNRQRDNVAFVLWGKPAQQKIKLIDAGRHLIIQAPHPSPLSAHRGFFGSRPFSQINAFRQQRGLPAINWSLDR